MSRRSGPLSPPRRGMGSRSRIRQALEGSGTKRPYVQALFGRVAGRYDLTNDVMSLGLHRHWKKLLLRLADVQPHHVVLDLAAGTGDLALRLSGGPRVIAADLTLEMLKVGKARRGARRVSWTQCDAQALPLPDRSVDRVVIGYGLRNFADLTSGLAEIRRCLKPGGRLVALDFGHASPAWFHRLYLRHLDWSTAVAGWLLHRDVESYLYIPESLRRFPAQRGVEEAMLRLGFERCGYLDLLFGIMAINFGDAPE